MKLKFLFKLFYETFLLSAFTFGGGYVIVPLMKSKFVDDLKIIDEEEMLNLVAIGQSAPGAIAINTSILVGYKFFGLLGAFVCSIATILPPLIIITVISFFYESFKDNIIVAHALLGMRAGITSMIFFAVYKMLKPLKNSKFMLSLCVIALLLSLITNSVYIILATIIIGTIVSLTKYYKEKK